jgi:hypothetical protein
VGKRKYKYMENFKDGKIFIHGVGREWWWEVIICNKPKRSSTCYFSVESAVNGAKKYIERKVT